MKFSRIKSQNNNTHVPSKVILFQIHALCPNPSDDYPHFKIIIVHMNLIIDTHQSTHDNDYYQFNEPH